MALKMVTAASLVKRFDFPTTLTSSTLDDLLEQLDAAFYPHPSPGFKARWSICMGLTALFVLLNATFLYQNVRASTETPKIKALWFARRVERRSGRFWVLNPRPTLMLPGLLGCFEVVFLVVVYQVYCQHASQKTWFCIRALQSPLLFIPGWATSWAGLQSFLIVVEGNSSRALPAPLVNALFIFGGLIIFSINLELGIASAILGVRFWDSFAELRVAFLAVKSSLGDRTPTLVDFIPLSAPYQKFMRANKAWRIMTTWEFGFVPLLPATCLLVNVGGLLLALRLRSQLKQSVAALTVVEARNADLLAPTAISSYNIGSPGRLGPTRSTRDDEANPSDIGWNETHTLTLAEIRRLAEDEGGISQEPAMKVLALNKAMKDLIIIALTIAVVTAAFLVDSILTAIWISDGSVYRGAWPITEAAIFLPVWIYAVPTFLSISYLHYNHLVNSPKTFPAADSSKPVDPRERCRPPFVAHAPNSSFLAGLVGPDGSTLSSAQGRDEEAMVEGKEGASSTGGRRNDSLAVPPRFSPVTMSTSTSNIPPRRLSWMSLGIGRSRQPSSGSSGGSGGGQGIVINIQREVRDAESSWRTADGGERGEEEKEKEETGLR